MTAVSHVYKDVFPPVAGGIERHIDTLRRSLPTVSSNVVVCARALRTTRARTPGGGAEIKVGEFGRVLSVPISPLFPLALARTCEDLVHLHMPNPLGELSVLATKRGVPTIAGFHADIVRQAAFLPIYRHLRDACLERADAIVVGSHGLRERSPALRPYQEKTVVIPYAVDLARFAASPELEARAHRFKQRFGAPLAVSVGRLVYYKGYDLLIEAVEGVDVQLVIAGTGPEAERLSALARGRPNVHLIGSVPDRELPALLRAADCFVLASTSRAESFGIATLEAQALGVPAIVADVGTGTREAIRPGISGLIVPARDVGALRAAMVQLLSNDHLRRRMAEAAREHIRTRHSADVAARAYEDLYASVLAANPSA